MLQQSHQLVKLNHSVNGTKTSAKDKVSERLLSEFKDNEKVTFLVKFKEQSDPTKIAKEAKENAKSKQLSAQQALFQQRSAVVADLKSVALESQYNVVEFLEKETERGNVEDFRIIPYCKRNGSDCDERNCGKNCSFCRS